MLDEGANCAARAQALTLASEAADDLEAERLPEQVAHRIISTVDATIDRMGCEEMTGRQPDLTATTDEADNGGSASEESDSEPDHDSPRDHGPPGRGRGRKVGHDK